MDSTTAIQDLYHEDYSHCFGCGRLNAQGRRIKTFWQDDGTVTRFTPGPEQSAGHLGVVYGGLLAALLDCHAMATAAAGLARARSSADILPRCVTASLHVDYLHPTALGPQLLLRGRVVDTSGRKAQIEATVEVDGHVTVRARVLAIALREDVS